MDHEQWLFHQYLLKGKRINKKILILTDMVYDTPPSTPPQNTEVCGVDFGFGNFSLLSSLMFHSIASLT